MPMNQTKKMLVHFLLCFILSITSLSMNSNIVIVSAIAAIDNREDFVMILYETLLERNKTLAITYTGSDSDTLYKEFDKIIFSEISEFKDSSITDDADYICGNLSRYKCQYYKYSNYAKFVFEFSYHETAAETTIVNSKVKEIISNMELTGKTTYEKIKIIHDYITKNVSYDNTYKNYSAYSALINKSTVCNGYALLTYKMLTAADIPCKYVTGFTNINDVTQEHAWNLVKVDGNWYNMDITWDDTDKENDIIYNYFLKGSVSFDKTHTRNERYNGVMFQALYPIVSTDYTIQEQPLLSDISLSFTKITLKKGKKISLTIKSKSTIKEIKQISFKSTKSKIASVTSNGKISAKKKGKANIKTTVVLTNGKRKTFTAKITVK